MTYVHWDETGGDYTLIPERNATFYSFKRSGKWYATGRGYLSAAVFGALDRNGKREQIYRDNMGRYPGLSGRGDDFVLVVIADKNCPYGLPLMLQPNA